MSFAHFARGLLFRILKQHDSAETSFRVANYLQPNVTNTLLELVRCLGEQEKYVDAVPFARQAVEIEPDSPACLGNLAMSLFMIGKKDEALGYIERALEIDPLDQINRQIYQNFEK